MSYLTYMVAEGKRDDVVKMILEAGYLERFRAEPGNLRYEIYVPADDPDAFAALDIWDSMASVSAHAASAGAAEYYDMLRPYVTHVESLHYTSDAYLASLARPDFEADGI